MDMPRENDGNQSQTMKEIEKHGDNQRYSGLLMETKHPLANLNDGSEARTEAETNARKQKKRDDQGGTYK